MSFQKERPDPDSHDMERDLLALLREDLVAPDDAESLLPLLTQLKTLSIPIDPQHKAQVIQTARRELEARTRSAAPVARFWQAVMEWWPLLLLRAQVQVVQREIWIASALAIGIGLFVTLSTYNTAKALPIVICAPLIAALGMALLYDATLESILELERGTLVSMRVLLLARMALVFGFNCLLSGLASLILVLAHAELSLWSLTMDWLAPMAFLSMLAFLISVSRRDSSAGIIVSLGLWMLLTLRHYAGSSAINVPDLTTTSFYPLLFMLAVICGLAAIWLIGRENHHIGETL